MQRLPLIFLSLNLCAGAPALAQETPTNPDATPEKKPATNNATVITVAGKKPDVVRKIDSRVYNTGDSPAAQSGTAADVLNTVPSVNVTPDGDVSLRGNGNVQVYINGKPSAMMQGDNRAATLQSMAGSDIASVEVITNPSARYDSNGGPIINIVLKSDRKPGANATLAVNLGNDDRRNARLSGNYNSGKLNLNGRIILRDDVRQTIRHDDRTWRNLARGTAGRNVTSSAYPASRQTAKLGGGLEYSLSDEDTLSLDLSASRRDSDNPTEEFRQDYNISNVLLRDYVRQKEGPNSQDDADAEFAYSHRAENGSEAKLNASRSVTINGNDRTIRSVYTLPVRDDLIEHFLSKTVTATDRLSGDYSHPFREDQELDLGFDWRTDNNRFDNLKGDIDPVTGAETIETGLTNRFIVTQRIYAAYLTWQGRFGKWQLQPGARLEGVMTRGSQITSAQQTRSQFANLTPTLHLAYVLSDDNRWKLSYTRSLQRPDARDLNPFLSYSDPQNQRSGNPYLKPQMVSALEGGYEHSHGDNSWSATAYYRESRNTITDYSYFLSADVLLTTKRNVGNGRSGGFETQTSGKWGEKWKYSLSGNLFYAELQAADIGNTLRHSAVSGTAQVSLDYKANDRDSLHLDGNYTGDTITAQGTRSGLNALNLSWKRKITPRLNLSISASDIYNGGQVRIVTNTASVSSVSYARNGGRVFFAGFSYRFGGAH
ncbi:TonB-dependent receptor domain-containing protein [Asticcacaulis taihuensis]|uniref:TonB-dependent receptor domain-containing protein n=1 Tax=Asticcacaulis taihuensis TaxID=260084 RepID=UPI003F7BB712